MRQTRLALDKPLHGEDTGLAVVRRTGLFLKRAIDCVVGRKQPFKRQVLCRQIGPEPRGLVLLGRAVALDIKARAVKVEIRELLGGEIAVHEFL